MYEPKPFSSIVLAHNDPVSHNQQIERINNNVVSNSGGNSSNSNFAARQRLRWTDDLHDRFVDAVTQLGGPDSKLLCLLNYFSPSTNNPVLALH